MSRLWKSYKYLFFIQLVLSVFIVTASFNINRQAQAEKAPTTLNTKAMSMGLSTPTPIVKVLATATEATPTPAPTPTPIPKLSQDVYKIAAIGDSMIDTMGGNLEYLLAELKKKYPTTHFYMYNYGRGSENVTEGLARFSDPFSNNDRHYPALSDVKPDIIIVGSWGYNPLVDKDISIYRDTLTKVLTKAKSLGSQVYLLAEIAPLSDKFGSGPGGVNWPADMAKKQSDKIVTDLSNARSVPQSLGIPLIDVYSKTTALNSPYGEVEYVDAHDNIHPSVFGHTFMAKIIASALQF